MASALFISSGTWNAWAKDIFTASMVVATEFGVTSVYMVIGINPGSKDMDSWSIEKC